jgi:hypothetical protein
MQASFWHKRMRRWRRPISVVALAAYLVSAVGLPLPASFKKQRGEAYPCMHHACGCLTAAECWQHCCCFSATEKLAWARQHDVEPPAQLLATVAMLASEGLLTSSACARNTCCTAAGDDDHDDHDHAHAPHGATCCDHHDSDRSSAGLILMVRARTCRGLGELWCLSGAVMPAPPALDWHFQWNVVEWLAVAGEPLLSHDLSPPIPPPRLTVS